MIIFPDVLGWYPSQSGSCSFWNVSEAKGLPCGWRGSRACAVGCFKNANKKTVVLRICTQKMLCKKRFESCFHMYPHKSGPLWANILFAFLKHPFVQWAGRWSNLVWFPSTQYLSITTIRFSFLGGSCWYWVRHQVPDHNSIKNKPFRGLLLASHSHDIDVAHLVVAGQALAYSTCSHVQHHAPCGHPWW